MRPWSDQAFLLRATPYGESDLVVVLLAPDHGRLSALAQGARKSKRRFGGVLDYFHLLQAEVRPSRSGLARLLGVELVRSYPGIREDVDAYWAGSHVLEVVRFGSREGSPDPALFRLVAATLGALDGKADPGSVVRSFQVRTLTVLGYGLALESCAACGAALEGGAAAWEGMAFHCGRCATSGAKPVSTGALRTLRAARDLPFDRLAALRFSAAIDTEVKTVVEGALVSALGARPRSLGVVG